MQIELFLLCKFTLTVGLPILCVIVRIVCRSVSHEAIMSQSHLTSAISLIPNLGKYLYSNQCVQCRYCDKLAEGVTLCREHQVYFDLCYFAH